MFTESLRDTLRKEIRKSENFRISPQQRTAARHHLIDIAIQLDDYAIWLEIGHVLVQACNVDDMVPRLSDRFIEACPDKVFSELGMNASPCKKFQGWRRRTTEVLSG